jgi:CheY-like chemotaxis protein
MILSKKILLAEDDIDDQQFFSKYVSGRQDVIFLPIAENGEDVISYLKHNEHALPDVIVLDQNMPKLNGMQTLQYLKSTPAFSRIPVVLYSSFADDNLKQQGAKSGAALVYAKPMSMADYEQFIDLLIRLEYTAERS